MSALKEDALFARNDQQERGPAHKEIKSTKYLMFLINDGNTFLKFGVNTEYVVEILNDSTAAYLPMMPHYVPGIFNMRGQIIPVMDFRLRLDKPASEAGLLVVLDYNHMQIGVLVDAVDRIIDIPDASISQVPSHENQRFVSGMCTIPDDGSTMMVLDCEQLLAHE